MATENIREIIAPRLRALREESSKAQNKVAEDLGITPSVLAGYESSSPSAFREPPLARLIKLADYYDVSTDYLLGRIDSKKLEYKSVFRTTGLNEESVTQTKELARMGMGYIANLLISNEHFTKLVADLYTYTLGSSFNPYLSGRIDAIKEIISSIRQSDSSTEPEMRIASVFENEFLPSLINNLNDFMLNEMKSLIERIANDTRRFSDEDNRSLEEKFEYGQFPDEDVTEAAESEERGNC